MGFTQDFFPKEVRLSVCQFFYKKIGESNIKKQNGYGLIRKKNYLFFNKMCHFDKLSNASLDQFLAKEKSFWPYHELHKKLKCI